MVAFAWDGQALSYGAIGLGFLLALMTFFLLRREQGVDRPRPAMLRSIMIFMSFAGALASIGFVSEYLRQSREAALGAKNETIAQLQIQVDQSRDEAKRLGEKLEQAKVAMTQAVESGATVANRSAAEMTSLRNKVAVIKADLNGLLRTKLVMTSLARPTDRAAADDFKEHVKRIESLMDDMQKKIDELPI